MLLKQYTLMAFDWRLACIATATRSRVRQAGGGGNLLPQAERARSAKYPIRSRVNPIVGGRFIKVQFVAGGGGEEELQNPPSDLKNYAN